MKTNRLLVGFFAASLVVGSLAGATRPAEAANGCSGSVEHYQLYTTDNVPDNFNHGSIDVYYSPENGGTNCIVVRGYNLGSGRHQMMARFGVAPKDDASAYRDGGTDYGEYYSYAGPIKITNTDGLCVVGYAEVVDSDGRTYQQLFTVYEEQVRCG